MNKIVDDSGFEPPTSDGLMLSPKTHPNNLVMLQY